VELLGFYSENVTNLDDANVAFGDSESFIGTIDRATGDPEVKAVGGDAYPDRVCDYDRPAAVCDQYLRLR
jgi:hypothetical protein